MPDDGVQPVPHNNLVGILAKTSMLGFVPHEYSSDVSLWFIFSIAVKFSMSEKASVELVEMTFRAYRNTAATCHE